MLEIVVVFFFFNLSHAWLLDIYIPPSEDTAGHELLGGRDPDKTRKFSGHVCIMAPLCHEMVL